MKEYKNIVKLCIKEGEILPGLLDVIEVSEEYDFTEKELDKLQITEESSRLRQQKRMDLEEKLGSVHFTGDFDEVNDQLNKIYNEELMAFIGRHLEYQKLLK